MDELDSQLVKAAEVLLIISSLRLFIARLGADRNQSNAEATDATILFAQAVLKKYLSVPKTKVKRDLTGKFIPISTPKN